MALEGGGDACRVRRAQRQEDGHLIASPRCHSDLGALEVERGHRGPVGAASDRKRGRARDGVACGHDVDQAVDGLVLWAARARAAAGRADVGAVHSEELDGDASFRAGAAEGGGDEGLAAGARLGGKGPWQVHEGVHERRHLGAGAGGELDEECARSVKAGSGAMDGDAVGGEGRVVAHDELDAPAMDDLLSCRVRGLDVEKGSPAEGRRRVGFRDHLELDERFIEYPREKARAPCARVRVAGRDGPRAHEVATDAALAVQVGVGLKRRERRGLGGFRPARCRRPVRARGGVCVAHGCGRVGRL